MARRKNTFRQFVVVGKLKADRYSQALRERRIKYKRKKVGARSWEFTLSKQRSR